MGQASSSFFFPGTFRRRGASLHKCQQIRSRISDQRFLRGLIKLKHVALLLKIRLNSSHFELLAYSKHIIDIMGR